MTQQKTSSSARSREERTYLLAYPTLKATLKGNNAEDSPEREECPKRQTLRAQVEVRRAEGRKETQLIVAETSAQRPLAKK